VRSQVEAYHHRATRARRSMDFACDHVRPPERSFKGGLREIAPDRTRRNTPTSTYSHSRWPALLSTFMTAAELRRLARIGAEARLGALQREIASIHQAFPDLRRRRSPGAPNPYTAGARSAVGGVRGALKGAVTRRRPKMSRQARTRIAAAQRKRWAEWRAKHAETEGKEGASHARAKGGSRKKK
jgi:hypothetical protein